MKKWPVVLASLVLVASGCAQQAPQPQFTAEDEAAIRALLDEWRVNLVEGQAIANVDLYTEDGAELLANPREGREAIRTRWEGFLDRYEYTEVELSLREIIGWGDFAYGWIESDARYLLDGNPRIQDATWMVLFHRGAEGNWGIYRGSWMASARADSTAMETTSGAGS